MSISVNAVCLCCPGGVVWKSRNETSEVLVSILDLHLSNLVKLVREIGHLMALYICEPNSRCPSTCNFHCRHHSFVCAGLLVLFCWNLRTRRACFEKFVLNLCHRFLSYKVYIMLFFSLNSLWNRDNSAFDILEELTAPHRWESKSWRQVKGQEPI